MSSDIYNSSRWWSTSILASRRIMRAFLTFGLLAVVSPTLGWGILGHQITATIAHMYLLPSAREKICKILPETYKCNLVGIASWADEIKQDDSYKPHSKLHYINAKNDNPPNECVFGDSGWKNEDNIIKAIVDESLKVTAANKPDINRDHALRFLIHFVGDVHQPFHLTGKHLAGNNVKVFWNRRETNLHAVWDDSLIEHQVLFVDTEYTRILPTSPSAHILSSEVARNQRIEAALKGLNYDPYIRFILLEGVYKLWAKDVKNWISCPQNMDQGSSHEVLNITSGPFQGSAEYSTVCPLHWAAQTHPLLCTSIWPNELTSKSARKEISGSYAKSIRKEMIVEKQLAMAGIRLAGVLNELLGSTEDKAVYGLVPFK